MMYSFIRAFFACLIACFSVALSAADIGFSPRHIVILSADTDHVWGHYFFAVNNKSSKSQRFRGPLLLPREAIDFRVQDGLQADEMQLDAEGTLFVDKEFSPGLSLLTIGFQVAVSRWEDDVLTFVPPTVLPEFSVAVNVDSGLSVSGEGFAQGLPEMLQAGTYRGIQTKNMTAGVERRVVIAGIPKERNYLYVIGGIFALILGGAACFFVCTRERVHEASGK